MPEVTCFRFTLQYDSKVCVNLAALSTSVSGAQLISPMALTSKASMGTKCGTPETDKTTQNPLWMLTKKKLTIVPRRSALDGYGSANSVSSNQLTTPSRAMRVSTCSFQCLALLL